MFLAMRTIRLFGYSATRLQSTIRMAGRHSVNGIQGLNFKLPFKERLIRLFYSLTTLEALPGASSVESPYWNFSIEPLNHCRTNTSEGAMFGRARRVNGKTGSVN